MREYKSINTNEWISLVNSEAHPTLEHYKLEYLELEGKFGVHLMTGYGSFLSSLADSKKDVAKLEKDLITKYEGLKGTNPVTGLRAPGAAAGPQQLLAF